MRRLFIPIALISGLAACDSAPAPVAPEPAQTAIPVEPDGGIGDGAEPLGEVAQGEDPAEAANTIPARYQGVWDYEGGTCALESDLRMEVSADEILFYESIGKVLGVEADGDDIIIRMEMEGEGETWVQATRFSLMGEEGDLRLHTSDGDAAKEIDEYPSKRCPSESGEA